MNSTLETDTSEFTTLGRCTVDFAVEQMDEGHLIDVRQQTVLRYRVFIDDAIRFATGFCIFTNVEPGTKRCQIRWHRAGVDDDTAGQFRDILFRLRRTKSPASEYSGASSCLG